MNIKPELEKKSEYVPSKMKPSTVDALDNYCEDNERSRSEVVHSFVRKCLRELGYFKQSK